MSLVGLNHDSSMVRALCFVLGGEGGRNLLASSVMGSTRVELDQDKFNCFLSLLIEKTNFFGPHLRFFIFFGKYTSHLQITGVVTHYTPNYYL